MMLIQTADLKRTGPNRIFWGRKMKAGLPIWWLTILCAVIQTTRAFQGYR
jgi:hypothetical protein